MTKTMLESCKSETVAIPKEVLEKCGFSSHQRVMIKEGERYFVVRQSLSEEKMLDPATQKVLRRLRIPAGSLAHLATGSGGSGDFDVTNIE